MNKNEKSNLDFFESDMFKEALKDLDEKRMSEIQKQLENMPDVPIYIKTQNKIEKLFKLEQMSTIDKIYFYSNKLAMGLVISGIVASISMFFM